MKTIRTFAVAALFVLVATALPATAQQLHKESFPDTPEGRADAAMLEMRLWIQNAQIKLKSGVTGAMSTEQGSEGGPAGACCTKNLKRIREERQKLQTALREINECYEARGDREAIRGGALTLEDLDAMMRSVEGFARASNEEMAHRAIAGIQRTYLLLERSRGNMPACPQ